MPTITPGAGRIKRLKHELLDMKALSEKCPAIKFKVLDDSDAPEKYEVSFFLRTIIGEIKEKPVYREADMPSIFLIDLFQYPYSYIRTSSITIPPPFHPCFLENGQFDISSSWSDSLANIIIHIAKALQFNYIITCSFNVEAEVWIEKNKHKRYFPCDDTVIPDFKDIHKTIPIQRKDDVNA